MVDQESRSYRPRRAFIEPEAEPTPPPAPDPAPAPATVSRPAAPNFDDEDLDQLKTVPGSAFEAVQAGPLQR